MANEPYPQLKNVLTIEDLAEIQPLKHKFLRVLCDFIAEKATLLSDDSINAEEKRKRVSKLTLKMNENQECVLEDLCLTFVINPPSKIFEFEGVELVENGKQIDVTCDNVEEYVDKCVDFYLNVGIREQVSFNFSSFIHFIFLDFRFPPRL